MNEKKISKSTNCLPYRREINDNLYCFSSLFTVVNLQFETNALIDYNNENIFSVAILLLEKHFILIY